MPIEFSPRNLEFMVNSTVGRKRLEKREGQAFELDSQGNPVEGWFVEGNILDVSDQAHSFLDENPDKTIRVEEDVCGGVVSPFSRNVNNS